MLNQALGVDLMFGIEKVNELQVELTKYNADVIHALEHARKVSIDSDDDATSNVEFAGEMRKMSKKIEATKKEITEPARQFTAKVNALASGYTDKLDEAIDLISSKVGSFNRVKVERQMHELELQAIVEAAAGVKTDFAIMPVKENTKTALASTYQTSKWDIEIEDFSKIPVEFLMLNEALVKAAIKMGRDTIPGLKIVERKVTRIRTK
jgi:hypothetical protein